MNGPKRPFIANLELRITIRRIADVFEALDTLDKSDKEALIEEFAKHLREHMPNSLLNLVAMPSTPSPQSFSDRCRELAALAPNDRIQHILLKIAHVHEVEAALEAGNNPDTASSDAA